MAVKWLIFVAGQKFEFKVIELLLSFPGSVLAHIQPSEECRANAEEQIKLLFSSEVMHKRILDLRPDRHKRVYLFRTEFFREHGMQLLKETTAVLIPNMIAKPYTLNFYHYYFERTDKPFCGKILLAMFAFKSGGLKNHALSPIPIAEKSIWYYQ